MSLVSLPYTVNFKCRGGVAIVMGLCFLLVQSAAILAGATEPKTGGELKEDSELAISLSAADILQRCDEVRNPAESYEMTVEVLNHDGTSSRFQVYTKGNDTTLIKTIAPKRDVGRDLLMVGENMWAYVPNLKRSVRVSLSQKLSGQAANGDIARMRWADDYEADLLASSEDHWELALKAKKKGLTYDRLKVWIKRKNFHPIKAHYLALSGKLLKSSEFKEFKPIAGRVRPTKMVIEDAHAKQRTSTIIIEHMEKSDFPALWFKPDQLGR